MLSSIRYHEGQVVINLNEGTYIVDDLATLDRLIKNIKDRQFAMDGASSLYYYQGIIDLLLSARDQFIRNQPHHEEIFGSGPPYQSETL